MVYIELIKDIPIRNLIFLDESGANLRMAPLYGRAEGGERVYNAVPFNRGNRITMLSAISFEKVIAALYGEWAADGEIFLSFVTRCICPVLEKRHVVIMDNVAFHQVSGVKETIGRPGARLIYLPPYSPDLNPIEQMWGKVKGYLRKEAARTLDKFAISIKAYMVPAQLQVIILLMTKVDQLQTYIRPVNG